MRITALLFAGDSTLMNSAIISKDPSLGKAHHLEERGLETVGQTMSYSGAAKQYLCQNVFCELDEDV